MGQSAPRFDATQLLIETAHAKRASAKASLQPAAELGERSREAITQSKALLEKCRRSAL